MEKYLKKDTPFSKMVEAIIQYNQYQNEARAIELVNEALSQRETVLGYHLQYAFEGKKDSCEKAALLAKRPAFFNKELLIISYNEEFEMNNEPDKKKYVSELEKLLSCDDYYFHSQDYHNFIQMGLGEKYLSAIGPSGPNDEPFFGALCAVTEWESFKRFAPRHQILFAFAVAGPGGQNIWDAERLLECIDEYTLETYAPKSVF